MLDSVHITQNDKVVSDLRDEQCPQCSEPFAKRKVRAIKDNAGIERIVHSSCFDLYRLSLANERAADEKRNEEAKRLAKEAEREANREARGTDAAEWLKNFQLDRENKDDWPLWHLMEKAVGDARRYGKDLKDFRERLDRDPVHAMDWSYGFFESVARMSVAKEVIHHFEAGVSYEDIASTLERDVLRRARSPQHSTSPTSNLMEEQITAAKARLLDRW